MQSDRNFWCSVVSVNTGLKQKKKELCESKISCHRDSFQFALGRNYTFVFHFYFRGSEYPVLSLTL